MKFKQGTKKGQALIAVAALTGAWLLRHSQAAPLMELHYLVSLPWQSQSQLELEDRLTNARILELEQTINELEQQNSQFKQLLAESTSDSSDLAAPVIGRSVDTWWNQITLGRGSQDGIEPGYIVLGIGGLVGRVISVTPHTSRVQLVVDSHSRVGATVSRSRNLGYLKGTSSQTATMQFFSKVVDVKVGDTVATSPIGNLYPQGLAIGQVIAINNSSGAAPEATVKITAPIDLLEWTIVRPFKPKYG